MSQSILLLSCKVTLSLFLNFLLCFGYFKTIIIAFMYSDTYFDFSSFDHFYYYFYVI